MYDLSQLDTDGDGLNDLEEISVSKTNPNRADTDGDGLSDGQEVTRYGTDPRQADTDGDGVTDGAEVKQAPILRFHYRFCRRIHRRFHAGRCGWSRWIARN
jgi:hypothetical protein